jgi:hypothetical protein
MVELIDDPNELGNVPLKGVFLIESRGGDSSRWRGAGTFLRP